MDLRSRLAAKKEHEKGRKEKGMEQKKRMDFRPEKEIKSAIVKFNKFFISMHLGLSSLLARLPLITRVIVCYRVLYHWPA